MNSTRKSRKSLQVAAALLGLSAGSITLAGNALADDASFLAQVHAKAPKLTAPDGELVALGHEYCDQQEAAPDGVGVSSHTLQGWDLANHAARVGINPRTPQSDALYSAAGTNLCPGSVGWGWRCPQVQASPQCGGENTNAGPGLAPRPNPDNLS